MSFAPQNKSEASAKEVVSRCASRWRDGQAVDIDAICAEHPQLMPDLRQSLEAAKLVALARRRAEGEGRSPDSPTLPSMASLQRPLEMPEDGDDFLNLHIDGYSPLKLVSHGGQAALFRATRETTGQDVAIKVIWGGPLMTAGESKRFDRETTALAQLKHPLIAKLQDKGRTKSGYVYLVMTFIEGVPVDRYFQTNAGLRDNARKTLGLFLKIVRAIGSAHDLGIIHRDIKPSNVLVDQFGEPHVIDFGLAKDLEDEAGDLTVDGQFVGSLYWSSPEQLDRNEKVDKQSDVYALGLLMYYLVSGRFPYETDGSTNQAIAEIRSSAPRSLMQDKAAPAWVDERFEKILQTALSKRKDERFADANELAAKLEAYQTGGNSDQERRRSVLKRRAVWWSLIVLIALAGGGALWTAVHSTPAAVDSPSLRLVGPLLRAQPEGGAGGAPFEAVAPGDGYLVGLRVWIKPFSEFDVISGVQPLFRTADDEVEGPVYGMTTERERVDRARPGYAVESIEMAYGQRVDGIRIRYLKLSKKDETEATHYFGQWMGGKHGEQQVGRTGHIAVGIVGRSGDELDAIGLVQRAVQ